MNQSRMCDLALARWRFWKRNRPVFAKRVEIVRALKDGLGPALCGLTEDPGLTEEALDWVADEFRRWLDVIEGGEGG